MIILTVTCPQMLGGRFPLGQLSTLYSVWVIFLCFCQVLIRLMCSALKFFPIFPLFSLRWRALVLVLHICLSSSLPLKLALSYVIPTHLWRKNEWRWSKNSSLVPSPPIFSFLFSGFYLFQTQNGGKLAWSFCTRSKSLHETVCNTICILINAQSSNFQFFFPTEYILNWHMQGLNSNWIEKSLGIMRERAQWKIEKNIFIDPREKWNEKGKSSAGVT